MQLYTTRVLGFVLLSIISLCTSQYTSALATPHTHDILQRPPLTFTN